MRTMPTASPTVLLAEQILGEDLSAWVTAHRNDDRSWQWIANRLNRESGGRLAVGREFVRRNYGTRAAA